MTQTEISQDAAAPAYVIETARRLSESRLWTLQRAYFERQGIDAWRKGRIPHYVTSNSFAARAYADVALAFLRDCERMPGASERDPNEPQYIIELGAGPGRFGFHFLKSLIPRLESATNRKVVYVMTDLAERNIAFWREHPRLKPFVESGHLDFARYDVENPGLLQLMVREKTLAPGALSAPVLVFANYVFDTVKCDVFSVEKGQLFEERVVLKSGAPEPDLADPAVLAGLVPVDGDYYADSAWNAVLRDYRARMANTTFVMPVAASRCLRSLSELAGGRLLLLSADRGHSREETMFEEPGPAIGYHDGCFSVMVNYHALAAEFAQSGAFALHPTWRPVSINVSALSVGLAAEGLAGARQAYASAIDQFGPDAYFGLKTGLAASYGALTLTQLVGVIRLCEWDYAAVIDMLPALVAAVAAASDEEQMELHLCLRRVWDRYYELSESIDLAFHLAMLLYGMAYYPEALAFLGYSLEAYGPDPGTLYNIGMCYYRMRQLDRALEQMGRVLEIEPTFEEARGMRIKIHNELLRMPVSW